MAPPIKPPQVKSPGRPKNKFTKKLKAERALAALGLNKVTESDQTRALKKLPAKTRLLLTRQGRMIALAEIAGNSKMPLKVRIETLRLLSEISGDEYAVKLEIAAQAYNAEQKGSQQEQRVLFNFAPNNRELPETSSVQEAEYEEPPQETNVLPLIDKAKVS